MEDPSPVPVRKELGNGGNNTNSQENLEENARRRQDERLGKTKYNF